MNKPQKIAYFVTTGLVVLAFTGGGVADLLRGPDMVAAMQHLGYPEYLLTLLGVWKVLGALAIVVPRFPLLKEWAYAGMAFDLTGASVSHAAAGDPMSNILTPLFILALVFASWALRPLSRRLVPLRVGPSASAAPAPEPATA